MYREREKERDKEERDSILMQYTYLYNNLQCDLLSKMPTFDEPTFW